MISVVIPTLNARETLTSTLMALVPASIEGVVREVVIADGGSSDDTLEIADEAGAKVILAEKGRGPQLLAGAEAAKGPWLLFLHADTVLDKAWHREAMAFIQRHDLSGSRAGVFRFALDDQGLKPRALERLVHLRCALFKLPYGDQGLLIKKNLYEELGGYAPLLLMEDVDLVRRIGRKRLILLDTKAITSAARYETDGYGRRIMRNLYCLMLYFRGVSPSEIVKLYEKRSKQAAK